MAMSRLLQCSTNTVDVIDDSGQNAYLVRPNFNYGSKVL